MSTAPNRPEDRLLHVVLWQRLDQPGLEICRLSQRDGSLRLEGTVLVTAGGVPAEARYEVTCNQKWETQAARIALTRGPSTETVELRREEGDRWWRDGARVEELDGTTDVDLGFTPATNTLPIGRLSLEVGQGAPVNAAWLRFPDLRMEVLPQRYTRLDRARYRYESAGGAFVADLRVDEHGLVVEYGSWWKRIAEWSADSRQLEAGASTGAGAAYRTPPVVRPKAVCIFRRRDEVLVSETPDSVKGDVLHGPPGGAIEFRERSEDAARREIREELGADVEDLRLVGVLENIFHYEGLPGHEIIFVHEARFADPSYYERSQIQGVESGRSFVLEWRELAAFGRTGARLVPDGLYDLLSGG
jgi:hypothetical protein